MATGGGKLRVGLVGCGAFANAALVPAMRLAPIEVVAVCDRDAERALATAAVTGAGAAHAELDAMLEAGGLDAAVLAIGPHIYPDLAGRIMHAGLDVFVEKPPALSVAAARAMREAAETSGRRLSVGFMKRFATGYRMARELVSAPEFGAVTHVSARIGTGVWTPVWAERLDPFALVLDHSIHFLDLMGFFGGPVAWLCAVPVKGKGDRIGFSVVMQFSSGASGVLEVSNFESRGVPNERLQIMGGAGHSVTIENVTRVTYGRDAAPMERDRPFGVDTDRVVWEPNMTNIAAENASIVHMGYAGEMRHFAEALLAGEAPSPDIADGIAALSLANAVLASEGQRVDLAPQL